MGRCSGVIKPPSQRIAAHRGVAQPRTLPGQGRSRARRAACVSPAGGRPNERLILFEEGVAQRKDVVGALGERRDRISKT